MCPLEQYKIVFIVDFSLKNAIQELYGRRAIQELYGRITASTAALSHIWVGL